MDVNCNVITLVQYLSSQNYILFSKYIVIGQIGNFIDMQYVLNLVITKHFILVTMYAFKLNYALF